MLDRVKRINWTPYLFLAPALVILGLTVFLPALQAFYLSFTEYEPSLAKLLGKG